MSVRTKAQSPAGTLTYNRIIIPPCDPTFQSTDSSVANRAFLSYIEVYHDVTVRALGIKVELLVAGNMQLGLYNSSFQLVCATAATAVAGLTPQSWNWLLTTTNPKITAGYYWLGVVCTQAYVVATSGMQYKRTSGIYSGFVDSATLGNQAMVRMDAAYPLPALFIPVNFSDFNFYGVCIKI